MFYASIKLKTWLSVIALTLIVTTAIQSSSPVAAQPTCDVPVDYATLTAAIGAGCTVINLSDNITTTEGAQVNINNNLTLNGNGYTISPSVDNTGAGNGDTGAWLLVTNGAVFNINNVTLDAAGFVIRTGLRYSSDNPSGGGTVNNVTFRNITSPPYIGIAMSIWQSNVSVLNSRFMNIGRIGIYFGTGGSGLVDSIVYTGKGAGDHLDYGVEIERGASATVRNSTISNNLGVASSDGSTSAAVLATTYFAPGTSGAFYNNTFSNNTTGLYIGYTTGDTTTITANDNSFIGNEYGIVSTSDNVIDATNNWWGDPAGPGVGGVNQINFENANGSVNFTPFLTSDPGTSSIGSDPGAGCVIEDDRVNGSQIWDCAPPVVIYCSAQGIDVYRVDADSEGQLLFRATHDEINAVGVGAENLPIESAEDVTLWRLSSGYFQVNAFYQDPWKPYTVAWDACPPSDVQHHDT